jgi:hypothetical protein
MTTNAVITDLLTRSLEPAFLGWLVVEDVERGARELPVFQRVEGTV